MGSKQTQMNRWFKFLLLSVAILLQLLLQQCHAFSTIPLYASRSGRAGISQYASVHRRVPSTSSYALHAELDASASTAELDVSQSMSRPNPLAFLHVLWRFTRPHTLVGSALAIPAIHALAAPSYNALMSVPNLVSILYAMLPALLMNLFITGLNQITDVEIDKINKPDLPIAAGDLRIRDAICVVAVALVLSLWMGVAHPTLGSQGLNVALWGSGILGTMYSLPPFRLKRFPLLAAFCIVAVRGTIINAGFFAHAKRAAFGGQVGSVVHYLFNDRACMLSSVFFGIFGIVIALMKDVPDVAGDEQASVRTFSVRIGQTRVFNTMKRLLTMLFFVFGIGFVKAAFTSSSVSLTLSRMVVGTSAFVAGISVNKEAVGVNPEDSKDVYNYYMHLWKLFYLSYLLLPFAR